MAIAKGTTLADHLIPAQSSRNATILKDIILVIVASALMALSARIQIHLPFTPIAITLQTFVLMLVGATLGSWRAAFAMLLYLAEGASGLPVFSAGGGWLYLLTAPTAGFLWSYPVAAFVVGFLCERGFDRKLLTCACAMLISSLIIYAFGVTWFSFWMYLVTGTPLHTTQLDLYQGFLKAMLPFIPGDLVKIVAATALLPATWRLVRAVKGDEATRK